MRVLIVNPGGIGDQILLLPTAILIKEKYPSCSIDLITEPRSSCIRDLTNLFSEVREYDFKGELELRKLFRTLRIKKYKYFITTGFSYKANLLTLLSDAEIKIGFYKGIFSNVFLTHPIKLNKDQYTTKMFAELTLPLSPELKLKIQSEPLIPKIKIPQDSIDWVKELLAPKIRERLFSKKIVIHPGVSKLSIKKNILKNWPVKNWALLIEQLLEDTNNTIILTGGNDDIETIEEIYKKLPFLVKPKNLIDLSQKTMTIDKLAALISISDLLVCVDSAPMHIGVGLGKKLVAFFGPTDPKKLLPYDKRFTAVHVTNLECRPCLFDKRKESCGNPQCLKVTPEMMLDAIRLKLT